VNLSLLDSTMLLSGQVPACYERGVVVSRPSIHFCIVFFTSSTTRAPLFFFFFLAFSQIFAPLEHVFLCCILFQSALAYSNLLLAFPCCSQLAFPVSRLFHSTTCYSSNCVVYATPCELTSAGPRVRRFPPCRACMVGHVCGLPCFFRRASAAVTSERHQSRSAQVIRQNSLHALLPEYTIVSSARSFANRGRR
jgi:hypothetical protein